jgi:hypothetical protein
VAPVSSIGVAPAAGQVRFHAAASLGQWGPRHVNYAHYENGVRIEPNPLYWDKPDGRKWYER